MAEVSSARCTASAEPFLKVLRPLLPKDKQEELPAALRSFSRAEKLWQDEQHAQRLTSRER